MLKSKLPLRIGVLILSASSSTFALPAVKVTKENYRGWEGSYRVSNGYVDLVVVPKIGRVMFYGDPKGPNLLWENMSLGPIDSSVAGYDNFGGDKLWYAPQTIWNWPPDSGVDGNAHTVEVLKDGVKMTSGLGKIVPVKFIREIRMSDINSEVKFTNKMINTGPDAEVSIWQVTQLNNPSRMELPVDTNAVFSVLIGERIDPKFHEIWNGKLVITRHPKKSYKFGVSSKTGTLKAWVGGSIFESYSPFVRRAKYPDKGSSVEIFTSPDPDKYAELEHLSPLLKLGTREIAMQTVTWRMRAVP
jgi:hypothetical protein